MVKFKKKSFNFLIFFILLGITVSIIFSPENIKKFPKIMAHADLRFFVVGCLLFSITWLCDALALKIILKRRGYEYSLLKSLRTAMTGDFYAAVTPLASGGQPSQLYYLVRGDKVPFGVATAVLLNKSIVFHVVAVIYVCVVILGNISAMAGIMGKTFIYAILGLILSTIGTVLIILFYLQPVWIEKAVLYLFAKVNSIFPFKNAEKTEETIRENIEEYKAGVKNLSDDKTMLFLVGIVMTVWLTCYYSCGYFVYRALGYHELGLGFFITMQALMHVAVMFIPTPGNLGAVEYGFYLFFNNVYGKGTVIFALMLWRTMTYYYRIAIAGLTAAASYLLIKKDHERKQIMIEEEQDEKRDMG